MGASNFLEWQYVVVAANNNGTAPTVQSANVNRARLRLISGSSGTPPIALVGVGKQACDGSFSANPA
jgi:hypothetical protein